MASLSDLYFINSSDIVNATYDSDGLYHSFDDKPAVTTATERIWFDHGLIHRNGQPAREGSNGFSEWYQHGRLHRDDDQPAVISSYFKRWYQKGRLHRENDQPAEDYGNLQRWYRRGVLHRGTFTFDKINPAIVDTTMDEKEYYINGKKVDHMYGLEFKESS
jgi:hypothetical protein